MSLRFTDVDLLRAIAARESDVKIGPTSYALAEILGVSRQAVQRRLDRLRADGHVEQSIHGFILSPAARAKGNKVEEILAKTERQREDEGYEAYAARIAARRTSHV